MKTGPGEKLKKKVVSYGLFFERLDWLMESSRCLMFSVVSSHQLDHVFRMIENEFIYFYCGGS